MGEAPSQAVGKRFREHPIASKLVLLYVCSTYSICMNNHVHSAPQLERKKEKNREERKKNHTL